MACIVSMRIEKRKKPHDRRLHPLRAASGQALSAMSARPVIYGRGIWRRGVIRPAEAGGKEKTMIYESLTASEKIVDQALVLNAMNNMEREQAADAGKEPEFYTTEDAAFSEFLDELDFERYVDEDGRDRLRISRLPARAGEKEIVNGRTTRTPAKSRD